MTFRALAVRQSESSLVRGFARPGELRTSLVPGRILKNPWLVLVLSGVVSLVGGVLEGTPGDHVDQLHLNSSQILDLRR